MSTEQQEEMSGFGAVFSDGPIQEIEIAPEEEVTEEEPEVVAAPEPEPEPQYDLKAMFESIEALKSIPDDLRKVQGKYGEIHRSLQQVQQKAPTQLTAADLKRMSENYPDLANDFAADLSEILAGAGGSQPAFDPAQFEQTVASRTLPLERQIQTLSLALEHKDWKQVVNSPAFSEWKSALPAEEQQKLDTSWDAEYLAGQISAYKETIKPPPEVVPKPISAKTKVIQAAVTPAGSKASAPATDSEAEAFRRATGGAT